MLDDDDEYSAAGRDVMTIYLLTGLQRTSIYYSLTHVVSCLNYCDSCLNLLSLSEL